MWKAVDPFPRGLACETTLEAVTGTVPTYSLETNVVSYLLNGEMWKRAPFNLLRVKPGLAHLCSKYGIEVDHDSELEKSIKAFEWSFLHKKQVQLVVPPKVTLEIARVPQVSSCSWGGLWMNLWRFLCLEP